MRSAAEQWLALRHLAVTSLFMCIATVIAIFTSDISKYFKKGVDKGKLNLFLQNIKRQIVTKESKTNPRYLKLKPVLLDAVLHELTTHYLKFCYIEQIVVSIECSG